jgi:isopenicillin N synthase-like dioxygenase
MPVTRDFVPTIDMRHPDVAGHIDQAFRRAGFFQLVNHGISDQVIAGMLRGVDDFFDLPLEDRLACQPVSDDVNRGYLAKGRETVGYSIGAQTPRDRFEAFSVGGRRSAPAGLRPDLAGLFAPNNWPAPLPDLPRQVMDYLDAADGLMGRLLRIFAQALELPQDWFDAMVDNSPDTLRLNFYEAAGEPEPGLPLVYGQGPHSDYGMVTILLADPVPGLQVADDEGRWHDVIAADGALIVNAGDLLAQLTNDRWQSSLHRVLPPDRFPGGSVKRRSAPFFKEGNLDAVVSCLPGCCTPERPPAYPPVVIGDHLLAKMMGARLRKEANAISTVSSRFEAANG